MQTRWVVIVALSVAAVLGGIYGFHRFSAKSVTAAPAPAIEPSPTVMRLPWTKMQEPPPVGTVWEEFAKPLAIGTHEMLLFETLKGEGAVRRIWHLDWQGSQTESLLLNDAVPKNSGTYRALWSKAGLWLLGTRTVLIRPDGTQLSIEGDVTKGAAVALDDGSILRANDDKSLVEQLIPGRDRIDVQPRGALSFDGRPPDDAGGHHWAFNDQTLVKLNDGRVLMLGGVNAPKSASILSPPSTSGNWSVAPAASMLHFHQSKATAVLPDGRVVVAGGSDCRGGADDPRSVDVYDAVHDRWTSLPSLPFLLCDKAPTSLAVTPNGSLVAAGHAMANVMVLARDPTSANGFSSGWIVHGHMQWARVGGVVQAPSDAEVVVAGGSVYGGFDKISIASDENEPWHALDYAGAGAARRGALLFTGGGRRFDAGQWQYSAHAQLIDLRTGKAEHLPDIPFMSRSLQVQWLDDDRLLVKGRFLDKNGEGFMESEEASTYSPPSSGSLAVLNLRTHRWSGVAAGADIDHSELLDANDREVLLLSTDGVLRRLNLQTMETEDETGLPRKMKGGAIRWLPDNHVLIAGGEVATDWLSVVDDECEAARHAECPERYAGIGGFVSSASYQSIALGNGTPQETMSKAEASDDPNHPAKVLATVITRSGVVYFLTDDVDGNGGILHVWQGGIHEANLQPMPLPPDLKPSRNDGALLLAADPREPGRELLFFRDASIYPNRNDANLADDPVNLWLWDEAKHAWQKVLATDALSARSKPQPLTGVDAGPDGGRILSLGWHLKSPMLWVAKNP